MLANKVFLQLVKLVKLCCEVGQLMFGADEQVMFNKNNTKSPFRCEENKLFKSISYE